MPTTAPRALVSRTLASAGLTISKKTPSRVKGLPLISRGITLETWDEQTVRVRWTAGSYATARPADTTQALDSAQAVLEVRGGLQVRREPDALYVTRTV